MKQSFEFAGGEYRKDDLPPLTATPIEDILKHHNKRYVIKTKEHGDVVMKFLPQRMRRAIDMFRLVRYPSFSELQDEMNSMAPEVMDGTCEPEYVQRFTELSLQMQATYDLYFMGCIEYPFLTSMDDLDNFLESLDEDEMELMRTALMVLSGPAGRVDDTYLAIAVKMGVTVMDKEMLDNMTRQQYDYFENVLQAEHRMTEKLYREMGRI